MANVKEELAACPAFSNIKYLIGNPAFVSGIHRI